MKQPKKLNRQQKEKLTRLKLDWNDYMLLSEDRDGFTIISKKEDENGNRKRLKVSN